MDMQAVLSGDTVDLGYGVIGLEDFHGLEKGVRLQFDFKIAGDGSADLAD